MALLLLLPLVIWLLGDAGYALAIARIKRQFESNSGRTPDGILPQAETFETGNGKAAILFVPGFMDTPAVFRRMALALAANIPVHCRIIRLPGMGDCRPASLAAWQEEIESAYNQLRQSYDKVFLCGHSLGGGLILSLAPKLTPDGVILLAPLVDVSPARMPFGLSARKVWRYASPFLIATKELKSIFPTIRQAEDDPNYRYRADTFVSRHAYDALFEVVEKLRGGTQEPHLKTPPVLLITAIDDQVVDNQATEAFFAHWPAPLVHYRVPGGHSIPLGNSWRESLAQIETFLHSEREDK
ncbi:MAG: alpha/beta hydrolase [Kiritimatiellia bacterium]